MSTSAAKTWILRSFLVLPLSLSLACSSSKSGARAPTTPSGGSSTGSAARTFDAPLVVGSGPFTLKTTTAGLAALPSYKATLALSFEGTRAGRPSTWSKTYVMLAMKAPAARQLTIQKSGEIAEPAQVFMAEMSGAAYEKNAKDACTAKAITPGATLAQRFEPAGLLAGVAGADAGGSPAINGAASDHYTFDEHAVGQAGRATAKGEIWMAAHGGYILKYLLTTKGDAKYFGEGIEGALSVHYELTDIGKSVAITLPDDCPPGMLNVPRLADASRVTNVPSFLTYRTAKSLADIAAFYQAQIPALGWKRGNGPTATGSSVIEDFTRGTATLTVTASTQAGVTTVTIAETT